MYLLKDEIEKTIKIAYPVIIGQLGFIMMGVVDSIMVGSIGAIPLASATLANSLFILLFIVGLGISIAVTPLVAIAVGGNRYEECGVLFRQSLLVNMTAGVVLALLIIISSNFLVYIDQPPEVVGQAQSYSRILGLSVIPSMLFASYKQFIEGFSVMKPAMIVVLLANLINILVNWLLIFGKLGFPALGLNGAGWATFTSRVFMALVIMVYVMRSGRFRQYDVTFHFKSINKKIIRKILALGLPGGIQYFFEVGAFSFAVVMVGWLGTNQLAAHQIAINLASISFMSAVGVSAAGSIRVGNAVGKKNIAETRRAGFTAIIISASIMSCFGIAFISLRNILPHLYIENPAVISFASSVLVIAALFQISDGVQAVGIGILRGLMDVKAPTLITFIAYWIIALPIGYLLGFIFEYGIIGIWIGLLLGLTSSAFMLTFRFNRKSKNIIL
ncbi:MAG TPA: MATE family efflux transporter [Ignavibacteriaceae bacterium]|nr:MATE family efflux transporter [Ignavibacteriaceae bacterium]